MSFLADYGDKALELGRPSGGLLLRLDPMAPFACHEKLGLPSIMQGRVKHADFGVMSFHRREG